MEETPVVSVIMPVYNGERYLREAIDSILAQTFAAFEFLIVDDGSTDSSLDIIQAYTDPRIRVFAEPHTGIVAARNKGLAEARGEYVACMDADDVSAPQRLIKEVAYLQSHPQTVMVGSWARSIDAEGKPTGMWTPPTHGRQLRVALCRSNQFPHGSVMMRREAVSLVGGYRAAFVMAEDYDLWLRLGETGVLAILAEPLFQVRFHQSSTTAGEGSLVGTYKECAQRAALQRLLHRQDQFGDTTPPSLCATEAMDRGHLPDQDTITISDWAEALLRQRQLGMGSYLLLRALIAHPDDSRAWGVVRRCYMSKDTARVLLKPMRRALPRLSNAGLGLRGVSARACASTEREPAGAPDSVALKTCEDWKG